MIACIHAVLFHPLCVSIGRGGFSVCFLTIAGGGPLASTIVIFPQLVLTLLLVDIVVIPSRYVSKY